MTLSSSSPVLVVLGPGGLATARRLQPALPGAEIHCLDRVAEVPDGRPFAETGPHLRSLFLAGRPLIGLCAAGVLIRLLAPVLGDKTKEPPVLAVAEDGSAVVPLLGGHHGANGLARLLAEPLGIAPAITTAGDCRFGIALDQPPPGWRLANPEAAKEGMAGLLAGRRVRLEGEAEAPWLAEAALPWASEEEEGAEKPLRLLVTERSAVSQPGQLVYHPAVLALGVGCDRGCPPEELEALVRDSLTEAGLSLQAVAGLYSVDRKGDEAAVLALAEALGLPLRLFSPERLERETPRLANPSAVVFQEIGCHGVAEAAALAAAGTASNGASNGASSTASDAASNGAALVLPKRKTARATCAIARAPRPFDGAAVGQSRGLLRVVGIGPGQEGWRTPEASVWLAEAEEVVGYSLYLDLLPPPRPGQSRHPFPIGAETERVRAALDLAAEGRSVALVSSGDAGIYAMAALVFEEIDRSPPGHPWRRPRLAVTPGISALQAAAARIGAPLGHDFCAISLSDLLTPWEAIETRLHAAAQGDFVVAFYNPVSRRRTEQLARAVEILRASRPGETPVVLARNLGRPGESVTVIDLETLSPDQVDMLTLVLVGSSTTRQVVRPEGGVWVYTPRGYGEKYGSGAKS